MIEQEVTLGEIYRSQLKTEKSVSNLDNKLSGMVTQAEHTESMAEIKGRVRVGEERINELSERSTAVESGLAYTDSKIGGVRSALRGVSLAFITAVIAAIMRFITI